MDWEIGIAGGVVSKIESCIHTYTSMVGSSLSRRFLSSDMSFISLEDEIADAHRCTSPASSKCFLGIILPAVPYVHPLPFHHQFVCHSTSITPYSRVKSFLHIASVNPQSHPFPPTQALTSVHSFIGTRRLTSVAAGKANRIPIFFLSMSSPARSTTSSFDKPSE